MSLGKRLLLQVEFPRELQEEENSDNSMRNGVLKSSNPILLEAQTPIISLHFFLTYCKWGKFSLFLVQKFNPCFRIINKSIIPDRLPRVY